MGRWVFPRRLLVAGVTAALLFQAGAVVPPPVYADPPVTRTGGTFSNFGSASSTTGSVAFSLPAGSNRLVAMVSMYTTTVTVTSVTWKPDSGNPGQDQALTFVGRQTAPANGAVEIWQLANPNPSVAGSAVSHVLSASTKRVMGVHALAGVGSVGSAVGAAANSTAISVNVASQAGGLVLDVLYGNNSTTSYTAGAGQTEHWDTNTTGGLNNLRGAGSSEVGAASVTMSWTAGAGTNMALLGVSFNPSSAVPPSAPTLTGATGGNGVVDLTWTPPTSDGGSPITSYEIWRGTSPGGESLLTTVGVQTSYTDTTVTNGTTYYYQVAAVNSAGSGPRSNELSATPQTPQPPGPPTLGSATASNGSVALAWTPPASNGGSPITGYEIWRGTTPGGESLLTTVGNVVAYADATVSNGTPYYYQVAAVNVVGSGLRSNERSATPQVIAAIRWSFSTGIDDNNYHTNLDDGGRYGWSSKWVPTFAKTGSLDPSMGTSSPPGPGGHILANPGDSFAVSATMGQGGTTWPFITLELGYFNSSNVGLGPDGNPGNPWVEVGRSYAMNEAWESVAGTVGPAPRNTHHIHVRVPNSQSHIDNLVVARTGQAGSMLGSGLGGHANFTARMEAEPVNTATGNYVSSVTDFALPGRGLGFGFRRSYNSLDTTMGILGVGWRHAYEARLVINADGSRLFAAEDGARLLFWPDGLGGYIRPSGTHSGLAPFGAGFELTRRDQVRYRFDSAGVLTAMLDRNGNQLTFVYTAGQLTTVTDTVGRVITLSYDGNGRLASVSGPPSRSVSYTYDASGRLETVTDLRGKVTTYSYDPSNRLLTIVDPNLHTVVTNEYGVDGRISAQTDARGKRGTFTWDPATQTAVFTDARGGTWTDLYSAGVLLSHTDPLGHTTTYAYDTAFNQITVTDPRANSTRFTYDGNANMLTRTAPAPLSYQETWTYNSRNDVATYVDGRNNQTTFGYDAAGNLTSISAPLSSVTQFGRDPGGTGLLVSLTDPRGKITNYGYDAQANRNAVTTPLGNLTTMTHDSAGRMLTTVEPRGNVVGADPAQYTTTFTYDPADHLLTVTDPLSGLTTYVYDDAGNQTSVTDPNNRATTFAFDAANNLSSVTDARNGVTAYVYDDVGNLSTRTDANTHVTTYVYDLAKRLTSVTDPLSHVWSMTYDNAGNLATGTDANFKTTTYAYDALNRLTTVTYADPSTPTVTYGYDANGNRTSMTDGAGSESTTFDVLNRPTAITRGSDTFGYGYDPAGNVTSRTYPGQTAQTWTYDDDGRLSTANGATYTYDAAGNFLTATTPDGLTARYSNDRAGRLFEVAHTTTSATLSRFTYALDPAGNRTAMTTREGTVTYRYDELHRLTEACWSPTSCPGGPPAPPLACLTCIGGLLTRPAPTVNPPPGETYRTYTYDPVGNRLSEASNAGTTTYAYDLADRLTTVTPPGGGVTTYTFDANGNQTAAQTAGPTTITTVGSTTASGNNPTSGTWTLPAGWQPGDLALVWLYARAGAYAIASPAGITIKHNSNNGNNGRLFIGYRYLQAGDASFNWTRTTGSSNADVLWGVVVLRGTVSSGDPFNASTGATPTTGTGADPDPPAVTPTTAGSTVWAIGGKRDDAAGTFNAPTNYTLVGAIQSTAGSDASAATIYWHGRPASSENPGAIDLGTASAAWAAWTGAISPGAGSVSTFTYDYADRLRTATLGATTETYGYAGDGVRLSASTGALPSQTTKFQWDRTFGLPQLAIERDGNDALLRSYRHGLDLVSQSAGGNTYYYHDDGLNSVVDVTSSAGSSLIWNEYYSYGIVRSAGVGAGAPTNPFNFTGEQLDGFTGLYHLRARQYDPGTGRFLSTDPLTAPASHPYISTYAYVRNSPCGFVDPSGLATERFASSPYACSTCGCIGLRADASYIGGRGIFVQIYQRVTLSNWYFMYTSGTVVAQNLSTGEVVARGFAGPKVPLWKETTDTAALRVPSSGLWRITVRETWWFLAMPRGGTAYFGTCYQVRSPSTIVYLSH